MAALAAVGAVAAVAGLGSAGAAQRALRLDVHPRAATVGHRTKFRFRVTGPDGRPIRGAKVRFAGRSSRTGARGRARIVATLDRRGKWLATATKHGYGAASRAIRARRPKPIGFDGTCQFAGVVKFDPPLTNSPQPITQHARGPGSCSGTLVDRRGRRHQLDGAHVVYVATEKGDQVSCGAGSDGGRGALVFRQGRLHFTVQESRAAALAILQARGARSGSATITGNVSPEENPADVLQKCAGGGLKQVKLQGQLSTDGTISG